MTTAPDPHGQEAASPQSLSTNLMKLVWHFLSRRRDKVPRAPLTIDGDDLLAIWRVTANKISADPLIEAAQGKAALDDALRRLLLAELAPLLGDAEQMAAFCAKANAGRHNLKTYVPYIEDIDAAMIADLVEILTLLPLTGPALTRLCDNYSPTAEAALAEMKALAPQLETAGYQRSKADHLALAAANSAGRPGLIADVLQGGWDFWEGRRLAQALANYTEQCFNDFGKAFRDLMARPGNANTPLLLTREGMEKAKASMRELEEMIEIDRRCFLVHIDGLSPRVTLSLDHLARMIDGAPQTRLNNRFLAMLCMQYTGTDDLPDVRLAANLMMRLEHVTYALRIVPPVVNQWRSQVEQALRTAIQRTVGRSTDASGNIVNQPSVWRDLAWVEEQAQYVGSSILPLLPAEDDGLREFIALNMQGWRSLTGLNREIFLAFIKATRSAVYRAGDQADPKMLALLAKAKEVGF